MCSCNSTILDQFLLLLWQPIVHQLVLCPAANTCLDTTEYLSDLPYTPYNQYTAAHTTGIKPMAQA